MKRNSILSTALLLALLLGLLSGCYKETKFRDVSVTSVNNLYEPADNRFIVLQSSGSVYFEWERAYSEDNSIVYYEVLFDKSDGDFSDPIYVVPSDNRGLATGATITHKVLNRVASMIGIEMAEQGDLKWAVRSNRGLNFSLSKDSRTLTVTRISSVEDLEGADLFIAGEGAEQDQQFKATGVIGEYEIYTRLEAGMPYYFYSDLNGSQRTFEINADQLSFRETNETPAGAVVEETGVYRIKLDFEAASASLERITNLELVVSWTQRRTAFTYEGEGVWALQDYNVQLAATEWGFDERYKIVFTINGNEEHWGQLGPHYDDRPSLNREGYRDMAITEGGQWGGSQFKFPNELCDLNNLSRYFTDVYVYMTAEHNYTHDFLNIRD